MYVNAAQNHWLNRSVEAGLPIHFPPMTQKQLDHNMKGGSIFSDIKDALGEHSSRRIANDVESLSNNGIDALLDKLRGIGENKGLPKITNAVLDKVVRPAAQKVAAKVIGAVGKKLFGHGMGKNGCGVRGCKNGNKCGTMTTSQRLYPANQKPI